MELEFSQNPVLQAEADLEPLSRVVNRSPKMQTVVALIIGLASSELRADGVDLDAYLEMIEDGFIQQALQRSHGNKTLAAELLNLNRTTLIERLRKKGLLTSRHRVSRLAMPIKDLKKPDLSLTETNPPDGIQLDLLHCSAAVEDRAPDSSQLK